MAPTLESLGIDRLSVADRIDLVQQIWDSIPLEAGPSLLNAEQLLELRTFVAEDDANPEEGVPWEEVRAELLARFARTRG